MRARSCVATMMLLGAANFGCSSGIESSEEMTAAEATAASDLERATGRSWKVQLHDKLGTAQFAEGRAEGLLAGTTPAKATISFLERHRSAFGMGTPADELEAIADERDEQGLTHVRMRQHVRGVPVFGGELLSHYDASGALTSVSSMYFPHLRDLDVQPAFEKGAALDRAVQYWKANFQPSFETREFDGEPKIELGVHVDDDARATLAYSVLGQIDATDGHAPARMSMMIDAKTGAILRAADALETISGSGVDTLGVTRSFEVTAGFVPVYSMIDQVRGGLVTNTLQTGTNGDGVACQSPNRTSGWDASCVAAHRQAEVYYDFLKVFGRSSIDGNNLPLVSVVHYGLNYPNAFWQRQDDVRRRQQHGALQHDPRARRHRARVQPRAHRKDLEARILGAKRCHQ